MRHLFVCREYPPAPYPPGGIGTYVRHMADLLAQAGETVHVIAHRWDKAPAARQVSVDGRVVVHRIALDADAVSRGLLASCFPPQAFSWQAALLAEHLIEREGIDVVEAQDWEAPLYYLQLRRALGLGPTRQPPCVVHIHSPTEQIFATNGWDTTLADCAPAVAQEEYSIVAADAVLCPSRFAAEHAATRYRIDSARLTIIPYPLGRAGIIARSSGTWSGGSICHVGRLELRKGLLEWADAVAMVAAEHPDLVVEFVGGDTPLRGTGEARVGDAVRARVPRGMRRQLRFHGSRDRDGVIEVLSRSRAAVVPSRWENFPYSCIEAMASGLPVIASPNGGMRELVVDGVSGWIADAGTPDGLAGALRRALAAPGAERERMGNAAAAAVRRVCDSEHVVRQHLGVKRRLAEKAAPVSPAPDLKSGGIGLVVSGLSDAGVLDSCLAGVLLQTEAPVSVYLVCDHSSVAAAETATAAGWRVLRCERCSRGEAEWAAAEQLLTDAAVSLGLAFVDSRVRLASEFVATARRVLATNERVGLFSAWTHETSPRDRIRVQPCSTRPHIWHNDQLSPYFVVRASALRQARDGFRTRPPVRTREELLDRVMSGGWQGLTYPAVLGAIDLDADDPAAGATAAKYSTMARAVQRLHTPLLQWLRDCPRDERRDLIRQAVRHPFQSAGWLASRVTRW